LWCHILWKVVCCFVGFLLGVCSATFSDRPAPPTTRKAHQQQKVFFALTAVYMTPVLSTQRKEATKGCKTMQSQSC
jgi:hypothetical protein